MSKRAEEYLKDLDKGIVRYKDFRPTGSTGGHKNDFLYNESITGPQGAHFSLLREKHHTEEHVKRAKAYIKINFDVVSITVYKEKQCLK